MTYQRLEKDAVQILNDAMVPNPAVDARQLILYATGWSTAELLLHLPDEVPEEVCAVFMDCIRKREERIPLQHILGETEFMGLRFYVNEDVLCPRQDTETLVEEVLRRVRPGDRVLDLCTGSGCILVSVLKLGGGRSRIGGDLRRIPLTGVGCDISEPALEMARRNAWRNGIEATRAAFYAGDLFDALPRGSMEFDVIVSNPPYIRSGDIPDLMPEVRDHEPHTALDGGADGLNFYRRIMEKAKQYLNMDGYLFFEIGYDQGETVSAMLKEHGFSDVRVFQDLAGNDRVVMGQIRANYKEMDYV